MISGAARSAQAPAAEINLSREPRGLLYRDGTLYSNGRREHTIQDQGYLRPNRDETRWTTGRPRTKPAGQLHRHSWTSDRRH